MKLSVRTLALVSLFVIFVPISARAISPVLVISQLYLGAGVADAKLRNQHVELFNRGAATVSLQGWSFQFAQEGTNTWQAFPLSGSIGPGQYYLIRFSAVDGTANLPQPDLTIS